MDMFMFVSIISSPRLHTPLSGPTKGWKEADDGGRSLDPSPRITPRSIPAKEW